MKRKIKLHNRVVNYAVRRSKRARRLRLAVYCDGNFVVTIPYSYSSSSIDKYVIAKSQWVISKLDFFERLNKKQKLTLGKNGFDMHKVEALKSIKKRLTTLNKKYYRFKFNRITIKNYKTRWGSCYRNHNLNFNYKILFLTPKIRDYIMIHELCHLKEFNHSRKFWNLVARAIPDYKKTMDELKINGLRIT